MRWRWYSPFWEFEFIFNEKDLLLYKGWISRKEWLRYLYINNFKIRLRKIVYFISFFLLRRKTNKSTTPIRRYKPGNRK